MTLGGKLPESSIIQPPLYDEVIERFGLEILKEPGDFHIKNGDLATTKYHDISLGDPAYDALHRLVERWRYNAPALSHLFDLVFYTKEKQKELDENLNNVFSGSHSTSSIPYPLFDKIAIARYHDLNDKIGASELAGSVYAGSVVLVLANLLLDFKDNIDASDSDWKNTEPLFEGQSIGSVIVASANNFRHNDEWAKTYPPSAQQMNSIRVLAAAFSEPLAPDGIRHGFARSICSETLALLSGGHFEQLSARFFSFAHRLASNWRTQNK